MQAVERVVYSKRIEGQQVATTLANQEKLVMTEVAPLVKMALSLKLLDYSVVKRADLGRTSPNREAQVASRLLLGTTFPITNRIPKANALMELIQIHPAPSVVLVATLVKCRTNIKQLVLLAKLERYSQ